MYKKILLGVVALFVVFGIIGALAGGGEEDTKEEVTTGTVEEPAEEPAEEPVEEPAQERSSAAPEPKPKPEPPAAPKVTRSQENAVRAAENYLEFAPFSKKGLIDQLSSDYGDGYSVEDAAFAVGQLTVDWKEQAAKAAKNYLEMSPFSRQGLIEQLSSEYGDQYTVEEATHGVTQAGL